MKVLQLYRFLTELVRLSGGRSISIASSSQHLAVTLMPTKPIPDPPGLVIKAGYTADINDLLGNPQVTLLHSGSEGLYSLVKVPGIDLLTKGGFSEERKDGERQQLFSLLFENVGMWVDASEFHAYSHLPTYTPDGGWLRLVDAFSTTIKTGEGWRQIGVGFLPTKEDGNTKAVLSTFLEEKSCAPDDPAIPYRPYALAAWPNPWPVRISVRSKEKVPATLRSLEATWRIVQSRLVKENAPAFIAEQERGDDEIGQVFNLSELAPEDTTLAYHRSWSVRKLAAMTGLPTVQVENSEDTYYYTQTDYLGVVGYEGWQYRNQKDAEQPVLVQTDHQPPYRPQVHVMTEYNRRVRAEFETVLDPNLNANGVPLPCYMLNEGHPYITPDGDVKEANRYRLVIRAETAVDALKILNNNKPALDIWWKKTFVNGRQLVFSHPVFSSNRYVSHHKDMDLLAIWFVRACRSLTRGEKNRLTRLYKKLHQVSKQAIEAKRSEAENCRIPHIRTAMVSVADMMMYERRALLDENDQL